MAYCFWPARKVSVTSWDGPPNVVLLHPSGTIFYYWDLDIGTAFVFRDPPFPGNTDQCRKEQ